MWVIIDVQNVQVKKAIFQVKLRNQTLEVRNALEIPEEGPDGRT